MADWDAILEEELRRLDLEADPLPDPDPALEADPRSHFFPDSKDCDCCRGFMLACPCAQDGSPACEKCSNSLSLPSTPSLPEDQTPTAAAAFPSNNSFSRAVQASARAVMNSTAPALARAPSVTSTQDIFNFSVKIFPPPSSVLSRDMFKMMFLPGVRSVLAAQSEDGSPTLAWPDRGWKTQQEFETEVEAALQSRAYNMTGIFVARKLSEEEANTLVDKLKEIEIRACVVNSGNPPLISTTMPPPNRVRSQDMVISVPSHTLLGDLLGPSYDPETKRHHVVLYLPDLEVDMELGSYECSEYVDTWYDTLTVTMFTRVLGESDPSRGITRFTWIERGWGGLEKFKTHTKESLKHYGHCIFARKLSFHDAYVVHRRLERAGFISSMIMTPSLPTDPADTPTLVCGRLHPMSVAAAPPGMISTRVCDGCQDFFRLEEPEMRCDSCDYDNCSTCVCSRLRIPCPILFGKDAQGSMPYPPSDAGDRVAPRERTPPPELLAQFLRAAETGEVPDAGVMNALAALFGGAVRNAKPSTKPSVIAALDHKTFGIDSLDSSVESCVICMSDFVEGDVLCSLPCGHWFHSGEIKRQTDNQVLTNSDGVISKPSEDTIHSKSIRHYCGRVVGQSGYQSPCGGCDGICGPTNGCQCKSCFLLDAASTDLLACDGIIPWLKKNNECPLCRHELEADISQTSDLSGMQGLWTCPGCRRETTTYQCTTCGIRRNVVAAIVTAAPLFDMVDSVFFACLSYHRRNPTGPPSSEDYEFQALAVSVSSILSSPELHNVTAANWMIRDAVANLLQGALRGERSFAFQSSWMDAGSQALYIELVDRLTTKLEQFDGDGEGWQIERPIITSQLEPPNWQCDHLLDYSTLIPSSLGPLCDHEHLSSVATCPCGVDKKVVRMVQSAADVAEVFEKAERFAFRSMDLSLGIVPIGLSKQSELNQLRLETDAFLSGSLLSQLEIRGWKLRSQFGAFLSALQRGRREIPFENEFADRNSVAFFALFVRRIVTKIQENSEYSSFKIHLPLISQSPSGEDRFEDFSTQQFPIHQNTEGFLRVNHKVLILISRLIADGAEASSWDALSQVILPQFTRSGWLLTNAVSLMRRGVRDLQLLTSDVDAGSQSVVEAILRKVISLEKAKVSDPTHSPDNMPPPAPSLTRQLSVGSSAKSCLASLQQRLSDGEFKEVLFNLLQILQNLRIDQSDLTSRRLKKDHPMVVRCLLPHPEAMEILQGVGFQEGDAELAVTVMNRDHVSRTFTILSELARSLGLE